MSGFWNALLNRGCTCTWRNVGSWKTQERDLHLASVWRRCFGCIIQRRKTTAVISPFVRFLTAIKVIQLNFQMNSFHFAAPQHHPSGQQTNPLISDFFHAFVIFGNWFNVSFIDFYCAVLLPSLTSDLPQLARSDTVLPPGHAHIASCSVCVLCGILTGKSCTRRTLLYLLPFLIPPASPARTL